MKLKIKTQRRTTILYIVSWIESNLGRVRDLEGSFGGLGEIEYNSNSVTAFASREALALTVVKLLIWFLVKSSTARLPPK